MSKIKWKTKKEIEIEEEMRKTKKLTQEERLEALETVVLELLLGGEK